MSHSQRFPPCDGTWWDWDRESCDDTFDSSCDKRTTSRLESGFPFVPMNYNKSVNVGTRSPPNDVHVGRIGSHRRCSTAKMLTGIGVWIKTSWSTIVSPGNRLRLALVREQHQIRVTEIAHKNAILNDAVPVVATWTMGRK